LARPAATSVWWSGKESSRMTGMAIRGQRVEGAGRAVVWLGGLVLLAGCAAERTVLRTESRMGFGEAWSQQLGDEAKIKEKYASGFEIKEGRAVATGEKTAPFEKKEFAAETLEREPFAGAGRDVDRKPFSGTREYKTGDYETGARAAESGKKSRWAGRESGMAETVYPTVSWQDGERAAETGAAAESQKRFRLPGTGKGQRDSVWASEAGRYGVDTSGGTPLPSGNGGGVALSVEEVRSLLSPELDR